MLLEEEEVMVCKQLEKGVVTVPLSGRVKQRESDQSISDKVLRLRDEKMTEYKRKEEGEILKEHLQEVEVKFTTTTKSLQQ